MSESPATSTVPGGEDTWLGGLDRGTAGRNPLPQTEVRTPLSIDYHGTVGEQLDSIVDETGAITVSLPTEFVPELTRQLRKALQDLPAKETADKLVAFFFAKVNPIRYPIDERLFRQGTLLLWHKLWGSEN